MHYTTVQYSTVHYVTLHCTALCIALYYNTVRYSTVHYSTLRCIALHCIALHFMTVRARARAVRRRRSSAAAVTLSSARRRDRPTALFLTRHTPPPSDPGESGTGGYAVAEKVRVVATCRVEGSFAPLNDEASRPYTGGARARRRRRREGALRCGRNGRRPARGLRPRFRRDVARGARAGDESWSRRPASLSRVPIHAM